MTPRTIWLDGRQGELRLDAGILTFTTGLFGSDVLGEVRDGYLYPEPDADISLRDLFSVLRELEIVEYRAGDRDGGTCRWRWLGGVLADILGLARRVYDLRSDPLDSPLDTWFRELVLYALADELPRDDDRDLRANLAGLGFVLTDMEWSNFAYASHVDSKRTSTILHANGHKSVLLDEAAK